ncbi:hypothetical protein F5Y16DRAFT_372430 [Xylariaceae sp. FL0255]|nr:hypothetical protein F5Y16DRAFT_372430 [Xylariaceae sp. FL0255]
MASNAKSRQPRLRASCDGCFLAKVKCSKARPICSRCLACGIVCHYSPSSRAGKPKSDHNINSYTNSPRDLQQLNTFIDDKPPTYSSLQHPPQPTDHVFPIETGWTTPPDSVEGSMSRNSSLSSGIPYLDVSERPPVEHDQMSAPPELYSATMPWTPPSEIQCTLFPDVPITASHMQAAHIRSHSFDASMPVPVSWANPTSHGIISYPQLATPVSATANYFPSPTQTSMRSTLSHQNGSPILTNSGTCACFASCLQSFQALHHTSSPNNPPFDLILSLNRKAVDGCTAMLGCNMCLRQSGTHTATMLLATVIGKIILLYKSATPSGFGHDNIKTLGNGLSGCLANTFGVHFGTYQLDGEDGKWFQSEILARELRKLEELYVKFRDVCVEYSDDPDIARAVIGYLGHSLNSALEVINCRKGDMSFTAQEYMDMKNGL